MKLFKLCVLALVLVAPLAACGGKSKTKVTIEQAKAGRDTELFGDAVKAIDKGNYDQGRILLNTMVNTYPESQLLRVAKLAIADSFYLQGGTKSLAQAEVEYRDWTEFFPDDPLADDVMMKMAEVHLKQVMAPDRDTTHAKLAERQLKEMLRRYPQTDRKVETESLMTEVQEILAMHELKVARFYFTHRSSAPSVQMRTEEILSKYPNFSRFDEALWLHARAMADQEDTETASQDLTRLVRSYPHSEFVERAKDLLQKWGKPIPEPDPAKLQEPPPESKGLPSRMVGFVFGPKIDTSNKGVIIDRSLKAEEIVANAQAVGTRTSPGGPVTPGAVTTSNSVDDRPRRATGASQDVEVKAGSASEQKNAPKSKNEKDKPKPKDGEGPKVLRNP
jgi:outer membrane protein assembly factor BamD